MRLDNCVEEPNTCTPELFPYNFLEIGFSEHHRTRNACGDAPQHDEQGRRTPRGKERESDRPGRHVNRAAHGAHPHGIVEGRPEDPDHGSVDAPYRSRHHWVTGDRPPEQEDTPDEQKARQEDCGDGDGGPDHPTLVPIASLTAYTLGKRRNARALAAPARPCPCRCSRSMLALEGVTQPPANGNHRLR